MKCTRLTQGCITDQEPSTSFPNSSSSDPYHVSQSTPNFAITSSSQMGYPLVNTTVFSTGNLQHSHQALLTTQAGATISFIPTSAVDEINAINIIELSLLKDSRHGKRSITSQPLPREALCGLADNNKLISSNANIKQEPTCKMCASTLCRCSTPMDNIGDHNLLNIKTKYQEFLFYSQIKQQEMKNIIRACNALLNKLPMISIL